MERDLAFVAVGAATIVALGFLPKLMLGCGVPITAQSLGIMLCGTVLGWKRGSLAVLMFLLCIAIGLPVLAGGRGGLGLFVSPSAGYLVGFPLAAIATGLVMARLRSLPVFWAATVSAAIGGVFVLYIPGIAGMAVTLDKPFTEVAWLALVFLPGDLIKAVLAGIITATVARFRPGVLPTRR